MALLTYTKDDRGPFYTAFGYSGATNGGSPDTFQPIQLDRTPYSIGIQTSGTFSGSASIALHGSLDGANYVALNDLDGSAIALTAAGLSSARDAVLWVKPVMTSGDGSADINVTVLTRFDR